MSTLESEILTRVIDPQNPSLGTQAVLTLGFQEKDQERMEDLAEKARAGTLTEAEQAEIDSYERIGHFIALLRSRGTSV